MLPRRLGQAAVGGERVGDAASIHHPAFDAATQVRARDETQPTFAIFVDGVSGLIKASKDSNIYRMDIKAH